MRLEDLETKTKYIIHDKETNLYSAVTGTIKKNIQTTTIYIFLCSVGSYRFENILI
jgi:hypothetical protein